MYVPILQEIWKGNLKISSWIFNESVQIVCYVFIIICLNNWGKLAV